MVGSYDEDETTSEEAVDLVRGHFKEKEVPFLRTCNHCNAPLRDGVPFSVVCSSMTGFNTEHDTIFNYRCREHAPTSEEATERLLTSYAAIVHVKIHEPHSDSNPSERNVQVDGCDVKTPPSL